MADSTLDDFFAKKDKSKKGKAKSKYTTSDTIAKKLEEGGKKTDILPKKDTKEKMLFSSNNQSCVLPSMNSEQEDDEWKNIEEKEADYSGLRIQALSISEKEKEEEQLKEQMLSEQNGESTKLQEGQSGPWKVVGAADASIEEKSTETVEATPVVTEGAPKQSGTYRPPALRNAPTAAAPARRSRHAPLISSEVHFPSLSTAADAKFRTSESDRSFQDVKHGARSSKGDSPNEVKLDLENKFAALPENE